MPYGAGMKQFLSQYAVAVAVFLALDAIWLGLVARGFYVAELGPLLRDSPNFAVAFVFYLLFVAGLVYFVTLPAQTVMQAALTGAFFGLVAYATYDLTNLATLKGFSSRAAIVDMAWGAVLSASVCAVTVWAKLRFF
jgi:uncharacterized membrane protein